LGRKGGVGSRPAGRIRADRRRLSADVLRAGRPRTPVFSLVAAVARERAEVVTSVQQQIGERRQARQLPSECGADYAAVSIERDSFPDPYGRGAQFRKHPGKCHSDPAKRDAQRTRRNLLDDHLTDSSHKLNPLSGIDQFSFCRFLARFARIGMTLCAGSNWATRPYGSGCASQQRTLTGPQRHSNPVLASLGGAARRRESSAFALHTPALAFGLWPLACFSPLASRLSPLASRLNRHPIHPVPLHPVVERRAVDA